MFDILKQKLIESEMVLVGIGEEWEIKETDFKQNPDYIKIVSGCGENSPLIPYIQKFFIEQNLIPKVLERRKNYSQLAELLKDKNYFLVSLCTDGLLHDSGVKGKKLVEPCGTMGKLQCMEKCCEELYPVDEGFMEKIKMLAAGESEPGQINVPVCPKCGRPLVFNTIFNENYAEEGYLPNWQLYTKWLQGTVNRKLCILELGVGMRFPTVIRWPFEKVAFFNQKASFFRVHSKLYQTAEEIKDRSYGIQALPEAFFMELFKCS